MLVELIPLIIEVAWILFWISIILLFKKEIKIAFEKICSRLNKIEVGGAKLHLDNKHDQMAFSGLIESINMALNSEDLEKIRKAKDNDLKELKNIVFPSPDENSVIKSEAIRKLHLIYEDNKNNNWIPDYIFYSVTYGYGIQRVESSYLEREGLIEVSNKGIRLTEKGIKAAIKNN